VVENRDQFAGSCGHDTKKQEFHKTENVLSSSTKLASKGVL
jgi:hypothetical protein